MYALGVCVRDVCLCIGVSIGCVCMCVRYVCVYRCVCTGVYLYLVSVCLCLWNQGLLCGGSTQVPRRGFLDQGKEGAFPAIG